MCPAALAGRAPPASPRLRRTTLGSTRGSAANGGSSGLSSPPGPPPPSDRSRQSRARLGCHTAHPPSPRRPTHTIAAGSGSAASAPARSAAGRARPSGRAVADVPPAEATAQPAPSRPETCPVVSVSSCRRIPPAKSSPEAASPCPRPRTQAESTLYRPAARYFFGVSLALLRVLNSNPVVRTPQDAKALIDAANNAIKLVELLRVNDVDRQGSGETKKHMFEILQSIEARIREAGR